MVEIILVINNLVVTVKIMMKKKMMKFYLSKMLELKGNLILMIIKLFKNKTIRNSSK
jgi:hypothetical protein